MEKIWIGVICVIAAVCAGCSDPMAPIDHEHRCDREKRAVWIALGHKDEPPADLMGNVKWVHKSGGEVFYFLPFRAGCSVIRV